MFRNEGLSLIACGGRVGALADVTPRGGIGQPGRRHPEPLPLAPAHQRRGREVPGPQVDATRVVRFHNVYGPLGTYDGGREKAPAAICRKVAAARNYGAIDIWGDGKQTRSFMYVDDCVEGIYRIMRSDYSGPLNLGTDELVSVDDLVDIVSDIAGKRLVKRHDTARPQGVRGRNSDNSRLRSILGWEPRTPLRDGLAPTYRWIEEHMSSELRQAAEIAAE